MDGTPCVDSNITQQLLVPSAHQVDLFLHKRASMLSHALMVQDDQQQKQDTAKVLNFIHAAFDGRGRGTMTSSEQNIRVQYVAASNTPMLGITSEATLERIEAKYLPAVPQLNKSMFEILNEFSTQNANKMTRFLMYTASQADLKKIYDKNHDDCKKVFDSSRKSMGHAMCMTGAQIIAQALLPNHMVQKLREYQLGESTVHSLQV